MCNRREQAGRGLCGCCRWQCWRTTRSRVSSWRRIVAAHSFAQDSQDREPRRVCALLAGGQYTCMNWTEQSSAIVEWRKLHVQVLSSTLTSAMSGCVLVIHQASQYTASRVMGHQSVSTAVVHDMLFSHMCSLCQSLCLPLAEVGGGNVFTLVCWLAK